MSQIPLTQAANAPQVTRLLKVDMVFSRYTPSTDFIPNALPLCDFRYGLVKSSQNDVQRRAIGLDRPIGHRQDDGEILLQPRT